MNIRKRTGEVVPFQEEKILNAIKKAFSGQAQELDDRVLDEMLSVILKRLPENSGLTVERVQDEVERVLMECGHYEVAKAYILYREKRAALRRVRADLAREVGDDALEDLLRQIQKDFEEEVYPLSALQLKFESFCKPAMTTDAKMEALTKAAVELTTVKALQSIGYDTIASGDSYNDLEMILHSKAGFLFRGPDKIKQDYPDLPAFEDYGDLLAAIRAAL